VLAVVLVELAAGGAFVLWLLDRRGQAPGGFIKLVAGVDAVCAAAAVGLIPTILPRDLQKVGLYPDPLSSLGQALVVFLVLTVIQLATTFIPLKDLRNIAGILTVLVGVGVLEIAAISRPSPAPFDVFALVALPLGALDLGGATGQSGLVVALGLRIGVGLLMTLGVALAAWWTARMNTQSSTGLLYVGLGTALAGEISARVLFFLTGAAV
jgi:hypothetical protein